MPPKTRSSGKIVKTVVKKTKEVVKETVEVVVSPTQNDVTMEDLQNAVSSSSKETEKVEVSLPSAPILVNIPVEDPTENAPIDGDDDDETQPRDSQDPPSKGEIVEPQEKEVIMTTPPPQEAGKKRKQSTDVGEPQAKSKETVETRKKKKRTAKVRSCEAGLVFNRYVYRVLKQVHPELGMSFKAMKILNNMMNDMCEKIAVEAAKLSSYSKKKTLSSWDVQDAVKLILPGELGKHAIAEGTKAVTRYLSEQSKTK